MIEENDPRYDDLIIFMARQKGKGVKYPLASQTTAEDAANKRQSEGGALRIEPNRQRVLLESEIETRKARLGDKDVQQTEIDDLGRQIAQLTEALKKL